ncbi:MAG: hypothetical protein Q9162_001593 [Coniocarpon cinnabarinum]
MFSKYENGLHAIPQSLVANARILDLGCGTGIWCREMAEQYPGAFILGIDIDPPDEADGTFPDNCHFAKADFAALWEFPGSEIPFDVIHGRFLTMAVRDWPAHIAKAIAHLKPGGILQCTEGVIQSIAKWRPADVAKTPFESFCEMMTAGAAKSGVDHFAPLQLDTCLREANLAVLKSETRTLYTDPSRWPDANQKEETSIYVTNIIFNFIDMFAPKMAEGMDMDDAECSKWVEGLKQDWLDNADEYGYHGIR